MAVTSLIFETLNKDRLHFALNAYLRNRQVPSPKDVNAMESPFWSWSANSKVNLGVPMIQCLKNTDFSTVKCMLEEKAFCSLSSGMGSINVILSDKCRPKDLLRAYCEAFAKVNGKNEFSYEDFDQKAQKQGWKTSHLQMNTLGWKCTIE